MPQPFPSLLPAVLSSGTRILLWYSLAAAVLALAVAVTVFFRRKKKVLRENSKEPEVPAGRTKKPAHPKD